MSAQEWEKLPEEPGDLVRDASESGTVPQDVMALVQQAVRESYLDQLEDLREYATKVRRANRVKRAIREHLSGLRAARSQWGAGDQVEPVTVRAFRGSRVQDRPIVEAREVGQARTAAALDEYIEALEDRLEAAGDDAQLAQLELQEHLQRLSQFLQMMSNLTKMQHDLAMAVIRNLKA